MQTERMSLQESLDLITHVLEEAKQRQEENGGVYIFWGVVIILVSGAHFTLQQMGLLEWVFVPYLFIPLGALGSYFLFPHYRKKRQRNYLGFIIALLWIIAASNMMFLGFVLPLELGKHLTPFILILLGMALSISGAALKYRPLILSGILANVAGIGGFWIPWEYQPLLMVGVNLVSVLIPGILLNKAYRSRKYV